MSRGKRRAHRAGVGGSRNPSRGEGWRERAFAAVRSGSGWREGRTTTRGARGCAALRRGPPEVAGIARRWWRRRGFAGGRGENKGTMEAVRWAGLVVSMCWASCSALRGCLVYYQHLPSQKIGTPTGFGCSLDRGQNFGSPGSP